MPRISTKSLRCAQSFDAGANGRRRNKHRSDSANPAPQRAAIQMGEVLERVHSHTTVNEGLEIFGNCFVINIWEVDIESIRPQMLRVQRGTFQLGVGLGRSI